MTNMLLWAEMTERIVEILKRHFPNLTVVQVVKIAHEILQASVDVLKDADVKRPAPDTTGAGPNQSFG